MSGKNKIARRKRATKGLLNYRPGQVALRDRTAVPPNPKLMAGVVLVEDPDGSGAAREAYRAYRDDPLAMMRLHGHIDDVQVLAGRHWQAAYERVEISGAQAIDTTRVVVDGGRAPEPFTDAQRRAAKDLAAAARAVGQLGESVLRGVLALGMTVEQIAAAHGDSGQASVKFFGRLFRESLKILSVVFGYAMAER